MASAVDTQKIASNQQIQMWDHDPGATTAIVVSPDGGTTKRTVDMRDFSRFGVGAAITVLGTGGAITKLEIIASAASDMSSPVVVKDSGTVDADAVGDWLFEECTAEEIAQLASEAGVRYRYVAGRLTMDAADAEACVVYLAGGARFPRKDLTAATTIA
jgi:hypothetical protein